jgi:Sulfatase
MPAISNVIRSESPASHQASAPAFWWRGALKLVWAAYLILTSIYCLLAFLPYTYLFVVKEPPYVWISWFVQHHAALYWPALLCAAIGYWSPVGRRAARGLYFVIFALQVVAGAGLAIHPFMTSLRSDRAAYLWSLVTLLPLVFLALLDVARSLPVREGAVKDRLLIPYSLALGLGLAISVLYFAGGQLHGLLATHAFDFSKRTAELGAWSLISHFLLAILVLSALNLLRMAAVRTPRPNAAYFALLGLLGWGALQQALAHFLEGTFSFSGLAAQFYAAALAGSLTLLGFSLSAPLWTAGSPPRPWNRRALAVAAGLLAISAVSLPSVIGGKDFNGILDHSFTLFFWLAFSVCLYGLWPRRRSYSVSAILAVVIASGAVYKGLQLSDVLWAQPLGQTDDDISQTLAAYTYEDASFSLVHSLVSGARTRDCGSLCRIMRENSDIRDAPAAPELKLVQDLQPTHLERPNIFIFVIDSLRADYVGAYNPRVDFSPALDAFAHDSIVMRNAYTQYAGTSLSEPAIWAGALLLHAHYQQPFDRLNSLLKLAETDGYHTIVSQDEVLQQLLSPSDPVTRIDTHLRSWKALDVCTTVPELEGLLDQRPANAPPVLFYSQPKNVHELAMNDLPGPEASHWRFRPGFENHFAYRLSLADQCMGRFFAYLKAHGEYDNSIIIVTADHGHATGEFGRTGHSWLMYPEIMRVPLIIHLPRQMLSGKVYDVNRISAVTDVTPSLYYLLGHRPIRANPLFGRPLFVETQEELETYRRKELFMASDVRALYGILSGDGRFFYVADDSAPSMLFDLSTDPDARHNIATGALDKPYDQRIVENLRTIANFYDYTPPIDPLFVASSH